MSSLWRLAINVISLWTSMARIHKAGLERNVLGRHSYGLAPSTAVVTRLIRTAAQQREAPVSENKLEKAYTVKIT